MSHHRARHYGGPQHFTSSHTANAGQVDEGDNTFQLENFFVLRLPDEEAEKLNEQLKKAPESVKDMLSITWGTSHAPYLRTATVRLDKRKMPAKMVDLPCIIELMKTLDKKNFYKVQDMCQMLLVDPELDLNSLDTEAKPANEETAAERKKRDRLFQHPHGLAPPLRNARKRGFRRTLRKKWMDAPELESQLKRVLREDLKATSIKWEIIGKESQPATGGQPSSSTSNQTAESSQMPSTNLIPLIPMIETSNDATTDSAINMSTMMRIPSVSPTKMQDVFGGDVSSSSEDEEASKQT